jgi:hypothetical protein
MFLSSTLNSIIKRFEDEFPDTRVSVSADSAIDIPDQDNDDESPSAPKLTLDLTNPTMAARGSISDDNEDDNRATAIKSPSLSRSNSLLSLSSKALAHEEGRILRAGHTFRAGVVARPDPDPDSNSGPDSDLRSERYALLTSGVEMVGADPNHARLLHELLEELGDEALNREVEERGVVEVFKARKEEIVGRLREADPGAWDRFVESQEMARKNVRVPAAVPALGRGQGEGEGGGGGAVATGNGVGETVVED